MVSTEEDDQEGVAACKREGRQFGDKKAKSCRTLDISSLDKVIVTSQIFNLVCYT